MKNFEESMQRLEKLIAEMEQGGLSLDESIKRYEDGMKLLHRCEDTLRKAEQRILLLTRENEEDSQTKDGQEEAAEVPEDNEDLPF